jgi:predicted secreted protein
MEPIETTASYPHAAAGSCGQANFRFQVVGAGSGALALKYWRHWESEGSITRRFAVTIDTAP